MEFIILIFLIVFEIAIFLISHIGVVFIAIGIILLVSTVINLWNNRGAYLKKSENGIGEVRTSSNKETKDIGCYIHRISRKILELALAKSKYVNEDDYKIGKENKITYDMFEIANLPLDRHPLMKKRDSYIRNYIKVVNTYVKRYSDIKWSNSILEKYYSTFLNQNNIQNMENVYESDKELLFGIWKILFRGGVGRNIFYKYLILDILYTCYALNDEKKGNIIFTDVASHYLKIDEDYINEFYYSLYHDEEMLNNVDTRCEFKAYWKKNRIFLHKKRKTILIVANMSAGKSTLINAITGKKISKVQNESCTSKLRYIFNKAYLDGENVKYDKRFNMHVLDDELQNDIENKEKNFVCIGTAFRNSELQSERVLVIDTPGVNAHFDQEYKKITENEIVKKSDSMMVYLLNATNIGTTDERTQLKFIKENFKGTIIFAINKLDKFKSGEDSVAETIEETKKTIEELGFQKTIVVPISAYEAYLAKKKLSGKVFDEDEENEFERIRRKMKKQEYHFDRYYPVYIQENVKNRKNDVANQMLFHSGILQLENIIKRGKEYEKYND